MVESFEIEKVLGGFILTTSRNDGDDAHVEVITTFEDLVFRLIRMWGPMPVDPLWIAALSKRLTEE